MPLHVLPPEDKGEELIIEIDDTLTDDSLDLLVQSGSRETHTEVNARVNRAPTAHAHRAREYFITI